MQRAKAFFFVCAGLFLLALAYHLGATSATAQAGSMVTGFSMAAGSVDGGAFYGSFCVMTPNGDVYVRDTRNYNGTTGPLIYAGNFWSGAGPTPAAQQTWGQLKARYR